MGSVALLMILPPTCCVDDRVAFRCGLCRADFLACLGKTLLPAFRMLRAVLQQFFQRRVTRVLIYLGGSLLAGCARALHGRDRILQHGSHIVGRALNSHVHVFFSLAGQPRFAVCQATRPAHQGSPRVSQM